MDIATLLPHPLQISELLPNNLAGGEQVSTRNTSKFIILCHGKCIVHSSLIENNVVFSSHYHNLVVI